MQQMNAQVNKSLMNSYNMLNTAMCTPTFANYTVHYADNTAVETMTWQYESKAKIDIFEARFLCSKCDCVFEVNGKDLKAGKVPVKIAKKELIWCEGEYPDCHTKVIRYLEVD